MIHIIIKQVILTHRIRNLTLQTQNAAEYISISFLLYYLKFSLLLYYECRIALFFNTFSFHVKSYYKSHVEMKEKQ